MIRGLFFRKSTEGLCHRDVRFDISVAYMWHTGPFASLWMRQVVQWSEFLQTGCLDREYRFAEVFLFFLLFFFFFFCQKKFVIWGQNIFFQIRLKKQMRHLGLLFWYFDKFWSKKCLGAFSWNRKSCVNFYNYEPIFINFSADILLRSGWYSLDKW